MKHPQKSKRKEGSPVGLNPTILDEFFSASRTARRHGAGKQGLSDSWLATDQSRATPRQTPLDTLGRPQNTGEHSKDGKAPQQSVTMALSLIKTDGKLQIRLLKLRWAVERKARNDGLRNRTRYRTSDWARDSFPNWSRLKPTGYLSHSQE